MACQGISSESGAEGNKPVGGQIEDVGVGNIEGSGKGRREKSHEAKRQGHAAVLVPKTAESRHSKDAEERELVDDRAQSFAMRSGEKVRLARTERTDLGAVPARKEGIAMATSAVPIASRAINKATALRRVEGEVVLRSRHRPPGSAIVSRR